MSITTDRDVFIGGHLTFETKEAFRLEAAKRGIPMSELLSNLIEKFLDDHGVPHRRIRSDKEVPLPLEGQV